MVFISFMPLIKINKNLKLYSYLKRKFIHTNENFISTPFEQNINLLIDNYETYHLGLDKKKIEEMKFKILNVKKYSLN